MKKQMQLYRNIFMKENYKSSIILNCIIMIMSLHNIYAQKNVNVDLFHGRANVSIPIYNFTSKYLNLPITLEYNQADILIENMDYNKGWENFGWGTYSLTGFIPTPMEFNPGWVGLGWTLNAGGKITRSVNVLPDERLKDTFKNPLNGNFYVKEDNFYDIRVIGSTLDPLTGLYTYQYDTIYLAKPKDDSYEIGEDEFTFNFCGHSGTFLFYHGEWKVFSDENIVVRKEVDFDSENGGLFISKISLETSDGIIYTFGGSNAIEFTSQVEGNNTVNSVYSPKIATSWWLSQIESPEGDQINFEYENDGYDSYSPVTRQTTFSSRIKYLDSRTGEWVYRTDFTPASVFPSDDQITNLSVGNITNQVYLKEISSTTSPVNIQFSRVPYNARNYPGMAAAIKAKLDNIYIGGESESSMIQYKLSYIDNTNESLKLESIQKTGINNNQTSIILPPYLLEYYPNTAQLGPQALSKITFPTGGYNLIEYEKSYLDNRFRIKQLITRSSETDKPFFTNYYYSYNEAKKSDLLESGIKAEAVPSCINGSTGKPFLDITDNFFLDGYQTIFELKKETGYDCPSPDYLSWAFLKRPEIGYSSVWEVQSQEGDGGAIVPKGYTDYTFNNYKSGYINNYASKAGKLETKTEFNAANHMISSCYYEYEEESVDELHRYFVKSYKYSYNSVVANYGVFGIYYTKNPKYKLSKKEEYKDGSVVETNYKYDFNTDRLLEQSVIENKLDYLTSPTNGNYSQTTTTTTYKYADEFDIISPNGDVLETVPYDLHSEKNIPVEIVVKKDGKVIRAQFTKFKAYRNTNTYRNTFYRPFEVYNLEISTPLNDYIPLAKDWTNDPRYKLKTTYDLYDESGNLLQYQNVGGSPVSYYYNNIYQQPLMELKNCTYQELLNTESYDDPMKLRKQLPKAQITSYTYNGGGQITSIKGANGVTIYKEYDELGRLKYIKNNSQQIIKKMEYSFGVE